MRRMDELLGSTTPKPFGAGHVVHEVHIRLKCPTCRSCLIRKAITRYVWVCSTCGRDRRHGLWGRRLSKLHSQYLNGNAEIAPYILSMDFGVAEPLRKDFFEVQPGAAYATLYNVPVMQIQADYNEKLAMLAETIALSPEREP